MNILVCTPGRLLQHMDETPGFDASQLQVRCCLWLALPARTLRLTRGLQQYRHARRISGMCAAMPQQRPIRGSG